MFAVFVIFVMYLSDVGNCNWICSKGTSTTATSNPDPDCWDKGVRSCYCLKAKDKEDIERRELSCVNIDNVWIPVAYTFNNQTIVSNKIHLGNTINVQLGLIKTEDKFVNLTKGHPNNPVKHVTDLIRLQERYYWDLVMELCWAKDRLVDDELNFIKEYENAELKDELVKDYENIFNFNIMNRTKIYPIKMDGVNRIYFQYEYRCKGSFVMRLDIIRQKVIRYMPPIYPKIHCQEETRAWLDEWEEKCFPKDMVNLIGGISITNNTD